MISQDFFDKVDDLREPGITWTPLMVAPGYPSPFWPNFTANAGRGKLRMRNEKFPFSYVSHTCVTSELNPSFATGANWCAIQKYQCARSLDPYFTVLNSGFYTVQKSPVFGYTSGYGDNAPKRSAKPSASLSPCPVERAD